MSRSLTDAHRSFLQAFMSSCVLGECDTEALQRSCCRMHDAPHADASLEQFINTVNTHLQPLFMQIRKGMCETDGLHHYALVNTAQTDITRMASDYADNELELFRKTMDLIVESESGTASSVDILNCADSLQTKKMKKKDTEQVLIRLVQDKWLNEKRGEYTLSTRCIIEMDQYIRQMYPDVRVCSMCHNIALQGKTCENSVCSTKVHLPCLQRYLRGRSRPCCPTCNEPWLQEVPEHTASSQASSGDTQTPSVPQSRRRRTK